MRPPRRLPRREPRQLALRALRDAIRDIVDDQGRFELAMVACPELVELTVPRGEDHHPAA